ncbi:ISC system 2Fe-2S type ferredoxin [Acinetobacter tandoii]|jgi:2Fe-2S ferredoxin|uniref:2Fe-2S ferredoxin n=1 Tax=Acinetobacter tandoii TaxID=202954 RepID=A0A5N4W7B8_9GAMM|nr:MULTISPECIES: ISC system 2Fe-2S type ferredoxin [Acinetobacter]KAB1852478.1 ISC system 2Fe-2S type ferredoxin [Acinetobacter tandoii]UOG19022.1 ISC system 2Fe-2S type ferredoxin [Acinetobacter sp. PK01]
MPRIKVLPHAQFCPEGAEFEVEQNANLCESLLKNNIKIEHACDMSCACTTCHVIVRKGFDSLEEMNDVEADLLDRAWGLEPDSRLSCQVEIVDEDLEIEIPKYTINHASENH